MTVTKCPATVANCPVGYSSVYYTSYTIPAAATYTSVPSYTTSYATYAAVPTGNSTGAVQFTGAGSRVGMDGKILGMGIAVVLLGMGLVVL